MAINPKDKVYEEIDKLLLDTKREGIEDLVSYLNDIGFYDAPASTRFHGAETGALAKHSLNVMNCARTLAIAWMGKKWYQEHQDSITICALLHDLGKAVDFEMEGSHVDIGVRLAKKYGERPEVINAIASHHGDQKASSVISVIVAIADALSASRPGARNDSLENYIKRLSQLEEVGNEIKGVEKTYAVQAGRELRVVVKPEEVDDLEAHRIAREVKEKIEANLKYPGTIKITVVRETRAVEEAK